MTDHTKTLTALLIGAAAGAVLGILFAPDRGEKTRSKLMNFAKSTGEDLEGLVDEGAAYAKRKVEEGKDKASRLANEVQNKASEFGSRAEDMKDKAKTEMEDAKGRIKSQIS